MLSQSVTEELASEGPVTRLHVPERSLPQSQVPQAHTVHLWPELLGEKSLEFVQPSMGTDCLRDRGELKLPCLSEPTAQPRLSSPWVAWDILLLWFSFSTNQQLQFSHFVTSCKHFPGITRVTGERAGASQPFSLHHAHQQPSAALTDTLVVIMLVTGSCWFLPVPGILQNSTKPSNPYMIEWKTELCQ